MPTYFSSGCITSIVCISPVGQVCPINILMVLTPTKGIANSQNSKPTL